MFCAHHDSRGYVSDRGMALLTYAPRDSITEHGSVAECFEHLTARCGIARAEISILDVPDSRATSAESMRRMASGSFVSRSTPAQRYLQQLDTSPEQQPIRAGRSESANESGHGSVGAGQADTEIVVMYERHRWPEFNYAITRAMQTVMRGVLAVPRSAWPKSKRSPSKCGAACTLVAVVALSQASCATAVRVSDMATYNALVRHAPTWMRGGARRTRTIDAELVVRALAEIQARSLDIRPPRVGHAAEIQNVLRAGDADQTTTTEAQPSDDCSLE